MPPRGTVRPTTHTPAPAAMHPSTPHAFTRFFSLAALAGVLYAAWRRVDEVHSRQAGTRPQRKPDKLEVWEGEGGQNQMHGQPPEA